MRCLIPTQPKILVSLCTSNGNEGIIIAARVRLHRMKHNTVPHIGTHGNATFDTEGSRHEQSPPDISATNG